MYLKIERNKNSSSDSNKKNKLNDRLNHKFNKKSTYQNLHNKIRSSFTYDKTNKLLCTTHFLHLGEDNTNYLIF